MAYTTIDNPELYFQVQLYAGNGAADNAITLDGDEDMQPDVVWIKNREGTQNHCIFDSVRGVTKVLEISSEAAEATNTDTLDAFQTDGFRVDGDALVNTDGEGHVAYCWKMGTTSGIATDDGEGSYDITPGAYSFNATAKQSVIRWDGNSQQDSTLPHGLGVAPNFLMCKCREHFPGRGWAIYHHKNTSAPATDYLAIDKNVATADDAAYWYDKDPTATNIFLGNGNDTNATDLFVIYAFAEVQGYSKFGSYTGNGSNDGPFIYTGFKPAFVMTKMTSSTSEWVMKTAKVYDPPMNINEKYLYANVAQAEVDSTGFAFFDFLSNGFKWRNSDAAVNADGGSYVYMAWAESPFVNSNGIPTNAR